MQYLAAAVIALPLSYSIVLPSSERTYSNYSDVQFSWDLCKADGSAIAFSSNLGGNGPDTGAKEFRIKDLDGGNGVKLDLVVTVAEGATYKSWLQQTGKGPGGAYVSPCPSNKCSGERAEPKGPPCYGVIPFQVETQTKFNFKLVEAGSSTVQVVPKFSLKIFELDRERDDWDGQGPDNEFVDFNTLPSDIIQGSGLKKVQLQDGVWRIESLEMGRAGDNPAISGPPLTKEQEKRSADVVYTNLGEWDVTFGHFGGKSRFDRAIYFSGSFPMPPTPSPTPSPTPAPTTPFQLLQGESLSPNGKLLSKNGRYEFVLQGDGNCVIYDHGVPYKNNGKPIWHTDTHGSNAGKELKFQADGQWVLLRANGAIAWNSKKKYNGGGSVKLIMQEDGNLVEYADNGQVIWESDTDGKR